MAAQRNRRAHPFRIKAVTLAVASCFTVGAEYAEANPTDPSVVSGGAVFNRQGNVLSVTNTPGAVINWRAFSIGSNEVTRFIQQSAASSVLNRVTGVDPSVILGALQSNGRVFLINPNGILFGAGAQVDVAGLVASTLNLSNADFAAGRLRFTDTPGAGAIANQGSITTPSGGQIYLIAPNVQNSGVITSPKGEVILAAGRTVEIVDAATPNLRIEITAPDTQAVNLGAIIANSGKIGIYAGLIKNSGEIRADSVVVGQNGEILLKATNGVTLDKGSVVSASGPTAGKVTIQADNGTVSAAGTIAANATQGAGGTVAIAGAQGVIVEPTARISADGVQGGAVSIASASGSVTIAAPVSANATAGRAGLVAVNAATTATLKAGAQLSANGVQGGTVSITSGSGVTLESGSTVEAGGVAGGSVNIQVNAGTIDAQGTVDVTGTDDNGGTVGITAGGDITLDITSRILARGRAGGEVRVEATQGTLLASGLIDGQGNNGPGGKVWLLAPRVALIRRALIDVSGKTGGGEVLVGGDYQGKNLLIQNASRTYFGADAIIRADAITSGNGGKVIIWSNDGTQAYGTISARGGAESGNGGFVETSGKAWLDFAARVDGAAPHGASGRLLLDPKDIDVNSTGGGAYVSNHLFADNVGGMSIIDPANINSQTLDVLLQADNNITFSSPILIANPGTKLTAQAGNSIFVNADIKTTNGDITLTANDSVPHPGDRAAGAAVFTMAAGTKIDAGTGDVRITMGTGAGHAGAVVSGDIILSKVTGKDMFIEYDGFDTNGSVIMADAASVITARSLIIDLFNPTNSVTGAGKIGTHLLPLRVTPNGPTINVEAHAHLSTGGIYIQSTGDLTIGGAVLFFGSVKGVQTLSGGPIELSAAGKLSQFAGTGAICGSGALTGGPICAGGGSANPADSLTLRATDMDLQRPVNGWDVFLLPNAGGTITLGSAGSGGSLHLSQSEINQVSATFLHVGDDTSDNVTFAADLTIPQLLDIRTGGSIASGGNTLTVGATGDGNLDLHAQTGIQLNVKTATLSALNAGASGNIDITETGASGILTLDSSDFPESLRNNAPLGDIFLTTSNRSLAIVNSVIGQRDITLTSTNGDITVGALATSVIVDAGRDITINAVNGRLTVQGGDTTLGFGAIRDASAKINAGGNLTVNAAGLTIAAGNAVANGISSLATTAKADAELTAGGNMLLNIGTLGASITAGNAQVTGEFGDNYFASAGATVSAIGNVTMTVAAGSLVIAGGTATAAAQSGSATLATANANTLVSAGPGKDLSITVSSGDLTVRGGTANAAAFHRPSDGSTLGGNNDAFANATAALTSGRHLNVTVSSGNLIVGGGAATATAYQRIDCCSSGITLSGRNNAAADASVNFETTGVGGNLTINLAAGAIMQVGGNQAVANAYHSASSSRANVFSGDNTATATAGIAFNAAGALSISGTPTSIVRIGTDASPSFFAQRPYATAYASQRTYGGSDNNLNGTNQATAHADVTFNAAGAAGLSITAGELQVRGGSTTAQADHKAQYGNSNTLAGDNTATANSQVAFNATHASGDLTINVGTGPVTVTGARAGYSGSGIRAYKRVDSGDNHDLTTGNNNAASAAEVKFTAGHNLGITAGNLSVYSDGGAVASAAKRITGSNASFNQIGGTNTASAAANTTFSAGNNLSVGVGSGSVNIYGAAARAYAKHTIDGGEGFVSNTLNGNNGATANGGTVFNAGGTLAITANSLQVSGGWAYANAQQRVYGSSFGASTHDNTIAGTNNASVNTFDSVSLTGGTVTLNLGTAGLNISGNSANAHASHSAGGNANYLSNLSGDNIAGASSNITLKATAGALTVNSTGGIWITGSDARASAYKYVYGSNLGSPNHFVGGNNTATATSNITLSGAGVTLSLGTSGLTISGGRATANAYHNVSGSGNTLSGSHTASATTNTKIDAGGGALQVTSGGISIADGGESGGGAFAHAYLYAGGMGNTISTVSLANQADATRNITLKGASVSLDAGSGSVWITGAPANARANHSANSFGHSLTGDQSATATSNVDIKSTAGGLTVNAAGGVYVQGSRGTASAYKYVNGSSHTLNGNNNANVDTTISFAATGGPLAVTAGTLVLNSSMGNGVTLNAYKQVNSGINSGLSADEFAGGGADIKFTSSGNVTLDVAGNFLINNNADHFTSATAYQKINSGGNNTLIGNQTTDGHADIVFDAGGTLTVNVTGGGSLVINNSRDNWASAYAYRRISGTGNNLLVGTSQATGHTSVAFGSAGDMAINVTGGSLTVTTGGSFPYNYTSAYAYNEIYTSGNDVSGGNTSKADALITFTSRGGNVTVAPAGGMTINGNYGNYTSAYAYNEINGDNNVLNVTNTATGTAKVVFDAALDLNVNVAGGMTARSSYGAAYAYNEVSGNTNNLTATNTSTANSNLIFNAGGNLNVNVSGGLTVSKGYSSVYAYNDISGNNNVVNATNAPTGNPSISFAAGGNLNVAVLTGNFTLGNSYASVYAFNEIGGDGNTVNAANSPVGNSNISFTGNNIGITVSAGNFTIGNSYASVYAFNDVSGNLNTVTGANAPIGNSNITFTGTNNLAISVSGGNFTVGNSYASVYAFSSANGNGNALSGSNTALGNANIGFTGNSTAITVSGGLNLNGSYASAAAYNRLSSGSGNTFGGANSANAFSNIIMNPANTLSIAANGVTVQAGSAYGNAYNNLAVAANTVSGTNTILADGNIRLSAGLTSVAVDAGTGSLTLNAGSADVHAFNINTAGGGNTATGHANVLVASGAGLTVTGAGLTVRAGSVDATTSGSGANLANGNANAGILALGTNTVTVTGSVNLVGGSISASGGGAVASAFAMLDPAALTVTANDMNLTTNSGGIILAAPGAISITTPGGFLVNGTPIAGGFAGFTSDPGVNFGLPSPITSSVVSSDPLVISFGGTNKNLTTLFGLPMAFLPPPPGAVFWDDQAGDHLWMNPINWSTDALPMLTQSVTIGSFAPITLNGAAPNIKSLFSDTDIIVTAGGSLTIVNPSTITTSLIVNGGTLTANGGLTVNALNLSAGALNGTGNLVVGSSFIQTGGAIGTSFGLIDFTQAAGNLSIGNALSAGTLNLTASAGNIDILDTTVTATGAMTVNASGNLNVTASAASATLQAGGMQTIAANGINLQAASSGSTRFATIHSAGGQSITAGAGGITLNAGGGTANLNSATIYQTGAASPQSIVVTGGGAINIKGGAGTGGSNFAYIWNQGSSGGQTINFTAGGTLALKGANAGTGNNALLENDGGIQSILGSPNITLGGGNGGTNNYAWMLANAGQSISATNLMLSGGTGGSQNYASIEQAGTSANQTFTINSGGTFALTGGGGTQNYANVVNLGNVQAVNFTAGGSLMLQGGNGAGGLNSAALIEWFTGVAPSQTIAFIGGGSVSVTGGSVGSINYASISSEAGNQTISGAPNITLLGGASGGTAITNSNLATISLDGFAGNEVQTISANNLTLTGGAGGTANAAFIRTLTSGQRSIITTTGAVALNGSSGTDSFAAIGSDFADVNITLNAGGPVVLNGGTGGSSAYGAFAGIGAVGGYNAAVAVSSQGAVTLNKGAGPGADAFVGTDTGIATVSLSAGIGGAGNLALNDGLVGNLAGAPGAISLLAPNGQIIQTTGAIRASSLFLSSSRNITLPGANDLSSVSVAGANNLTLNSINPTNVNGATTTGAFSLAAPGNMSITSSINAGSVSLNAGGVISIFAPVNAGSVSMVSAGGYIDDPTGSIITAPTITLSAVSGITAAINTSGTGLTVSNTGASGDVNLTNYYSATPFTIGGGGAAISNAAPGGRYLIDAKYDMNLNNGANDRVAQFSAGGTLTVNGYNNASGQPVTMSAANLTFAGAATSVSGALNICSLSGGVCQPTSGGAINVFTNVTADAVNLVGTDLKVDAANFVSQNATFTGSLSGKVSLSNGGVIYGNPDIKLSAGNASVLGSGGINIDDPGSRIEAASANSIYISFPGLSSGGFFVNGTPDLVWDPTTGTGFFAGGVPAILGVNLKIDYGASGALLQSVVQAINTSIAATDQSVQFDDKNKKDKDPLKEVKADDEKSLGNNLKLMCN